ncbi:cohesin subunit SA-2-like [Dendronephthya gigantea]|uniref:cohesin subunit SA-2-like n=1 Tax=Dendronephthya gigantea TaxID=151771 RepID=UPI00106A6E71|nr:cohesin subunit SA-2-like [Dendronephthya gigantea]
MMDTTDDTAEELQSPLRKSSRKKTQTSHYGHESPNFTSPSSSNPDKSQESDITEFKPTENSDNANVESSDDDLPLSQYTPEKGKKRSAKTSKKLPSAKKLKTKRKSGALPETFPEKGSMFDIIKGGRDALQTVVDDWIESYSNDRESAMVDLIQVVIQCCGCKGTVSEDMLEEEENVNAIRKLTEEFDEDTHEYPLTMSRPEYKKFKHNFCEFIGVLIEQCQHSIVYDDYMMEKLISWLISLSDSQVRAFRHTSTLAGMRLVAALIQIALKVKVEYDNTERQLLSEKGKSVSKRGVQKMEMLQNKKDQLRDNTHALEEYMNFIFQGIFVHRYRDSRPEIRSLCISEIGTWMKEYSNYFLSHKYLKYVVWTLHDKDGDVRFHALQTLHKLYEIEEFLTQLEPLTSRFKGRIVSMTLDVEHTVTVVAIKLVALLYRYHELDEEDCQQVEQLVFCSHRQVAHEAGSFLNERLLAEAESSSPSKKKASKKSEIQRKAEYFKKLISFFVTSQIHDHAAYLVDSLWQHCDLLKDWDIMTSMLLDDKTGEGLSDDEESALIEIMTCCCRQAATGQGPPGRLVKRLLSTKEKKTIVNDKQEMSGHFMVQLPLLLGKYGTDLPKAENLITIPQYFDLEEFTQSRLSQHFEELLDQIDDLVQKGPETSLLEECAKTYRVLTDNELTLKSKAEVARNKLIDSIVELLKEGLQNFNPDRGNADDEEGNDDAYALEVNLRRIAAFFRFHDLGAWELYDTLNEIARMSKVSVEVCSNALNSLEMCLLWAFKAMKEKSPNKRHMRTLKHRVDEFMNLCSSLLEKDFDELGRQAFLCVCDIIVIFAKQLNNNYPSLSSLVYVPNDVFQENCVTFATRYAFSDLNVEQEREDEDENTESEVQELNNKRVVLSGLCKLFAYNIFDMHRASEVFSKFISAFGNFGDIIKHTMSKCREINIEYYTKTIVFTLFEEYKELCNNEDRSPDKTSEEYIALKELARRLALTYGIELTKEPIRKAMINLHRAGILLSLERDVASNKNNEHDENTDILLPYIGFFDIINECSSRLISQDKKAVLKILKKQLDDSKLDIKDARGDPELQSLVSYYKTILEGSQGTVAKATKMRPVPQKAKRKLLVEEVSSTRKTPAKRKSGAKDQTSPREIDEEQPPSGETSPVPREQPPSGGTSPVPRELQDDDTRQQTKRKRSVRSDETHEEENSEDEFQEPNSVKASSQASWVASQPKNKRSANHSRVSYGNNTKDDSRFRPLLEEEEEEEEEEFIDDEKRSSPVESPKPKTPPRKRTKRDLPEEIFEESPAPQSQSDEEMPSGLNV